MQRVLYRGLRRPYCDRLEVTCGRSARLQLKAGDIVSLTTVDGGGGALLTALGDHDRCFTAAPLGLDEASPRPLDEHAFDVTEMSALLAARGGDWNSARACQIFDDDTSAGATYLFKAATSTTLFVVAPLQRDYLSRGGGGHFIVDVQRGSQPNSGALLPEPLGRIVDEWRVDRGTALAYEVKKGQFVQVIDVEGQQCSDFMAMRADALDAGLERFIDSTVSRTMVRGAYPEPGLRDKFFDQDIQPLLAVRQDTVGRHDTFALACTARGYEERGFPGHLNCSDNISDAYEPFGIQRRKAWPAINFFFNSWMATGSNELASDEAWSRAGDYVAMQALTDLVCVTTACPDDVDPINGWNPTDIHVRVYEADSSIAHAIARRAQPDDAMQMTKHTPFHARTSKLTSNFAVGRDRWLPVQYDATGATEEYWACRNAATLQDMSSLLKYDVMGPDAMQLLQHCMTRDISKLAQHRGLYALMCDARGSVIDDGTLFRLEPAVYRWCCGSENSALHLREQAEQLGLQVWIRSLSQKMPSLALQGPKSRDILRDVVFTQPNRPSIDNLKWFGFTIARLRDRDGPVFMLSRTGFTGELGYEFFCDESDAVAIWDGLMDAGRDRGLVPMGSEALGLLRIEAGLMVAGAEFGPDADAIEAGLGFAVDLEKQDFIGRAALMRNAAAVRRKLVGLHFAGNEPAAHGDAVFVGREQVGVVTSACTSPHFGHAIAMARVAVENADAGTALEVGRLNGHMKRLPCTVTSLPFLDPKREKARA